MIFFKNFNNLLKPCQKMTELKFGCAYPKNRVVMAFYYFKETVGVHSLLSVSI